jgi:hypothetical protein
MAVLLTHHRVLRMTQVLVAELAAQLSSIFPPPQFPAQLQLLLAPVQIVLARFAQLLLGLLAGQLHQLFTFREVLAVRVVEGLSILLAEVAGRRQVG